MGIKNQILNRYVLRLAFAYLTLLYLTNIDLIICKSGLNLQSLSGHTAQYHYTVHIIFLESDF